MVIFPEVNRFFGKRKRNIIKRTNASAEKLMSLIDDYYQDFSNKLKLFNELKELVIKIKARIYDFGSSTYRQVSEDDALSFQRDLDAALDKLQDELKRIKTFITSEYDEERDEIRCSLGILDFIHQQLALEQQYAGEDYWESYKKYLLDLRQFLFQKKDGLGLFHVLASQLALLEDIQRGRREIKEELRGKKSFEALTRTLRMIEIELMRFGEYCRHESEIITVPNNNPTYKRFKGDMQALRALGLVYSERKLHPYNLGIVTTKLGSLGRSVYGAKGVGLIHPDNSIDFRFVRGVREKHAEILQVLFKGIPGTRLVDDATVKAYLMSLPLDRITKVAGFQLQLKLNDHGNLQVVNIDYESTILRVQMERSELSGEYVLLSKIDFSRLNYTLLFSINRELVDKQSFEMTIRRKGSKINVIDNKVHVSFG